MATIKAFTDLSQSKGLAVILPMESADMYYNLGESNIPDFMQGSHSDFRCYTMCWSLAALLHYLNEIKPQVYTPVLFPSEGKWILQFAEYGHGNVCEASCDNPVDACVAMVEKLHERKML